MSFLPKKVKGDDALICLLKSREESWVFDCADHCTPHQINFFKRHVYGNLGQVFLSDDQPCDTVG